MVMVFLIHMMHYLLTRLYKQPNNFRILRMMESRWGPAA
jgi:hypothetical protein